MKTAVYFNSHILFKDVTIGEHFLLNGNECVKIMPQFTPQSHSSLISNCRLLDNVSIFNKFDPFILEDQIVTIPFPEK